MYTKEHITNSLEEISKILGSKVKWIVGASGALFVHGLDILPNDLDIIVDPHDYDRAKELLRDYLTSGTLDLNFTLKTTFEVLGIDGELLSFEIPTDNIENRIIGSVLIPVNHLDLELNYYKQRKDKKEANQHKVALIEEELELRKNS